MKQPCYVFLGEKENTFSANMCEHEKYQPEILCIKLDILKHSLV